MIRKYLFGERVGEVVPWYIHLFVGFFALLCGYLLYTLGNQPSPLPLINYLIAGPLILAFATFVIVADAQIGQSSLFWPPKPKAVSIQELRREHALLVDKKFQRHLSAQEEKRLAQIENSLDQAEAPFYEPIVERLRSQLDKSSGEHPKD